MAATNYDDNNTQIMIITILIVIVIVIVSIVIMIKMMMTMMIVHMMIILIIIICIWHNSVVYNRRLPYTAYYLARTLWRAAVWFAHPIIWHTAISL